MRTGRLSRQDGGGELSGPGGASAAITIRAAAKVNLYLRVLGRRADGYHQLDSLVAFVGLHDTLRVAASDTLSLELSGPFAAAAGICGDDNLVLRAARALAAAAGIAPCARIALEKRIPVAAGLGGGSADAAAALHALSSLWRVAVSPPEAMRLARALGADVPVCLAGTAARVGGIGEVLRPVPRLPQMPVLLVNPGVPLPTAAVFARRSGAFSPPAALDDTALGDPDRLAAALAPLGNDLTAAAVAVVPQIASVLSALRALDGCRLARLSGSGATCFGLFTDAEAAAAAAARLAAAHPCWWVLPTALAAQP